MTIEEKRRIACRELTRIMQTRRPFSYLRLGDGELAFMLNVQRGREQSPDYLRTSCEVAYDGPGIEGRHYERLRESYESCEYLDYHDNVAFNVENLPKLDLARREGLFRNDSPDTAWIIFDWTWHEFKTYAAGRRCLLVGAEASLLRELHATPAYRALATRFWPEDGAIIFHQVRGDGRDLSGNLDLIKSDIAALISEHSIDTVFLALGGAAKIVGHELAQELRVCTIDWGSALRALAYCGSAGPATWRASHSPYLLHVPFDLHMDALERAHPSLPKVDLVAKAQAQLCLELQRKEPMRTFPADVLEPSHFDAGPENLARFKAALRVYDRRYRALAKGDPEVQRLVREFDYWCLKKGLGWRGKIFRALVRAKSWLRR
ncbi:MAG: hypothetical protein ABMA13_19160 [Chthoniobacteraceae bacterium]